MPDKDNKKRSIAVDFDATLASYDHWRGVDELGEPIPAMIKKVKTALTEGAEVTIFTARVNPGQSHQDALSATQSYLLISEWLKQHLGQLLPITYEKSQKWTEIWDDKAKEVLPNTGVFVTELMDALATK